MAINVQTFEKRHRWVTLLRGQMQVYGITPPALVEEHRFHPERRFAFDFALPGQKIGIEVEGGVFARRRVSRHTTGAGYTRDCEKYNLAAVHGWMVLRFTSPLIEDGSAVKTIVEAVKARSGHAGL